MLRRPVVSFYTNNNRATSSTRVPGATLPVYPNPGYVAGPWRYEAVVYNTGGNPTTASGRVSQRVRDNLVSVDRRTLRIIRPKPPTKPGCPRHHYEYSPSRTHSFVPTFCMLMRQYWARVVSVPYGLSNVTPPAGAIVSCPAPICLA